MSKQKKKPRRRTIVQLVQPSGSGDQSERRSIVLDRDNLTTAVDFIAEFDPVMAGKIFSALWDSAELEEARRRGTRHSAAKRRVDRDDDKTLVAFVRSGRAKRWSDRQTAVAWLRKNQQPVDPSDAGDKKTINAVAVRIARLKIPPVQK